MRYVDMVRNFCPGPRNSKMSKHEFFYDKKLGANKLTVLGKFLCPMMNDRKLNWMMNDRKQNLMIAEDWAAF